MTISATTINRARLTADVKECTAVMLSIEIVVEEVEGAFPIMSVHVLKIGRLLSQRSDQQKGKEEYYQDANDYDSKCFAVKLIS